MKKLLSLALACTLTLGLASCGGTGTSTSSNAPAAEDPHRSGGEPDGGLECIGCQPDSHGFQ